MDPPRPDRAPLHTTRVRTSGRHPAEPDRLYSSHGHNVLRGGAGKDSVWAYYGRGTIDRGPGQDTRRVRLVNDYRYRDCERVENFCAFGSKPGGGCYRPGEQPRARGRVTPRRAR